MSILLYVVIRLGKEKKKVKKMIEENRNKDKDDALFDILSNDRKGRK